MASNIGACPASNSNSNNIDGLKNPDLPELAAMEASTYSHADERAAIRAKHLNSLNSLFFANGMLAALLFSVEAVTVR